LFFSNYRKALPCAARFGGQPAVAAPRTISARATALILRRTEIRKLVEEPGYVPSSRALRDMLLCAGMSVGHVTVMADLRAMGLIDDSASRHHSSLPPASALSRIDPGLLSRSDPLDLYQVAQAAAQGVKFPDNERVAVL